ncbi:MAG TPA: CaiB/BaiF CoA-transferase family protein [Hyphomicrobiaceae bacterium]|nr:CaiB/BaiF CoA-transferase family protein [Hyphomicrobiaceae bacterium]
MTQPTGPLEGIRIVDLTSMLSGPWATMILADQGADVIKVEEPRLGDHTRAYGNRRNGFSASFLNLNRNKRSIAIDLKTPRGVDLLMRLCETADVLVQNFRPGVVERLGIHEAAIRTVAPDIVYVSINGFGEKGPYAHKPVYDPIVQAFSGLTTVQAGADDRRPRLIRTVLPDKLTAVTAAQAIAAALVGRLRTGKGQHVRLAMLDAVLAFLWASDMGAQTYVGERVSQRTAASFIDLIYETADGFMTVAVMTNKEWAALTRGLERPQWLEDARFQTPALRDQNIDARLEMTQDVLKTRTTEQWLERLEAAGVPCAPVLTREQVIQHPQVVASGILVESEHPTAGRLRQTRAAARFETPMLVRRGAPRLGEHSREILRELGLAEEAIAALRHERVIGSEEAA